MCWQNIHDFQSNADENDQRPSVPQPDITSSVIAIIAFCASCQVYFGHSCPILACILHRVCTQNFKMISISIYLFFSHIFILIYLFLSILIFLKAIIWCQRHVSISVPKPPKVLSAVAIFRNVSIIIPKVCKVVSILTKLNP